MLLPVRRFLGQGHLQSPALRNTILLIFNATLIGPYSNLIRGIFETASEIVEEGSIELRFSLDFGHMP